MSMHDTFKGIFVSVACVVSFRRWMRIIAGDVAVIDPCLLKGELSAASVTPLVHRQTRNLSTMIAAPDVQLIVRLAVILNVGLLRRRVSIMTIVAAA